MRAILSTSSLAAIVLVVVLNGAPARAAAAPDARMDDSTAAARLQSLSDMVGSYERELRESREEIRSLLDRRYKERRREVEAKYEEAIVPISAKERAHRAAAIASFEGFLDKHPDDRAYAPDAMFRLAELYFEKSDDEHQQRMAEWKDAYTAWQTKEVANRGSAGEPPDEPEVAFPKTIELYRELIARFPDYRLADGAYYLLGYTLRAQGETKEGMTAWRTLVNRHPKSRFYAEVWFRIGDQHFDDEEWEKAIAAFSNVMPMKQSPYYDKALYKLAWTYYLVNRFDDAVARFFDLLDDSYQKKQDQRDARAGSVLDEEAVQYVAISFADDHWVRGDKYQKLIAGTSLKDPNAEIAVDYTAFARDRFAAAVKAQGGTGRKPYERDVMARLGDILFKQAKNDAAVAALEYAIALDPLHEDDPKLQDQIIQAWERERQFDKAGAARDVLVAKYASGSDWSKRYIDDSKARRGAEDLAKASLYKAAIYYHQQASKSFEEGRQDVSVQYFKAASKAYADYLRRYPHDKNAYELGYYLAETFYYSLRFDAAVAQYEKVRDSTMGDKYKGEAALATVYAYEKVIERSVKDGKLAKQEVFTGKRADAEKDGGAIPALRVAYIGAIDRFLEKGHDHPMAPAFGYRAGEVLYSYGRYEEAVARFQYVVDQYPQTEAAKFAANLILDDLLAKKDWITAAAYASRFQKNAIGGGDTAGFAKIEGGAKFNLAKETLEKGAQALDGGRLTEGTRLLEQGSDQYLALIAEDPKREFADMMMYNAALSLEKARRPVRAAELYERLYKEYPTSPNAAEAMFRVATKNEQAFNFEKAVATYLGLVTAYPKSDRAPDAQINAALALEGQQKYERAAAELVRFATLFPTRPEAADVFFRAAIVHKKRGATNEELATLQSFIQRYGAQTAQMPRVIEAHTRLGEIYGQLARAQTDGKRAAELKQRSLEAHRAAVQSNPRARGSQSAAYFAAKSAFSLVEEDFASYARLKIASRSGKGQGKELQEKSARLQSVEGAYKGVITTYKQAEWSLASLYRIGALYDELQKSVLAAPCPDDVRRIADIACDEYRNTLEDQAFAVEQKAVDAYKVAFERSMQLRLSNDWSKRTLEALNLLRPTEYPIDKEPLAMPSTGGLHALGYVYPNGGLDEVKAAGPGPAESALAATPAVPAASTTAKDATSKGGAS